MNNTSNMTPLVIEMPCLGDIVCYKLSCSKESIVKFILPTNSIHLCMDHFKDTMINLDATEVKFILQNEDELITGHKDGCDCYLCEDDEEIAQQKAYKESMDQLGKLLDSENKNGNE